MSVPFGTPQRPASAGQPTGPDLASLLPLGAVGAGVVAYLLAFMSTQSVAVFSGLPGFCLIVAGALAGLRLLPKAPNTLYAAVPLAAFGALDLLQATLRGEVGGILVVILVLALLQLAAVLGALLMEAGVISPPTVTFAGPPSATMPPQGRPGPAGTHQGPWPPVGGQVHPGHSGPVPTPGGRHPAGGPPQPGQFPPPGPQQGWNPQQPGGQPTGGTGGGQAAGAGSPVTEHISHPGAQASQQSVSGQVEPPSGGQVAPPQTPQPGGPQGTQQMPHPGPPPGDS